MSPFRRILYATDFSPASRAAYTKALELAKQPRTTLFVLHVLTPPSPFLGDKLPSSYQELQWLARRDAERRLGAMVAKLRKGRIERVASKLVEGAPSEQIIRYANRWRADVIVIGIHGRSGLSRMFMGSVAERVLQRAQCPVLTVAGR